MIRIINAEIKKIGNERRIVRHRPIPDISTSFYKFVSDFIYQLVDRNFILGM